MSFRPPAVVCPERIRRLPPGFGWIDHRFIRQGFAAQLSSEAQALYLFLATVANEYGVSWYSTDKLCLKSGLSPMAVTLARKELTTHSLLVYACPVYQLLSLPESPVRAEPPSAEPGIPPATEPVSSVPSMPAESSADKTGGTSVASEHPAGQPSITVVRLAARPLTERSGEMRTAAEILRQMLEGGAR